MKAKHRELKSVVQELRALHQEAPPRDTLHHDGKIVYGMDLEENRRDLGPLEKYGLESGSESLVLYKTEIEGKCRTIWPISFEENF